MAPENYVCLFWALKCPHGHDVSFELMKNLGIKPKLDWETLSQLGVTVEELKAYFGEKGFILGSFFPPVKRLT